MTMMFFMLILLFFGLGEGKSCLGGDVCPLCEAAICAKHLSVDPAAIGSGKEGDDVCDIVRLTEAFEWRHVADLFDLLFRLAFQKKLCANRARCNGVDRNLVSAKLVGKNMDEAFDARLGSDVRAVGGEILGENAAGEGDDAPTLGNVMRRLREN